MAPKILSRDDPVKQELEKTMQDILPKLGYELSKVLRANGSGSGAAMAFYCSVPKQSEEKSFYPEVKSEGTHEGIQRMIEKIKTLRIEKEEVEQMADMWEVEAKAAQAELREAVVHIMKITKENSKLIARIESITSLQDQE